MVGIDHSRARCWRTSENPNSTHFVNKEAPPPPPTTVVQTNNGEDVNVATGAEQYILPLARLCPECGMRDQSANRGRTDRARRLRINLSPPLPQFVDLACSWPLPHPRPVPYVTERTIAGVGAWRIPHGVFWRIFVVDGVLLLLLRRCLRVANFAFSEFSEVRQASRSEA
jgi:hypothetical protein